ncbi:hypothetical protein FBU30_007886 [Linnemannia zychae]|nr:hypothetical protein FBU30_007886 [Linnemannia zychae]
MAIPTRSESSRGAAHNQPPNALQILQNVSADLRILSELPSHSIPRMFIIVPDPASKLNPTTNIHRSYRLFFFCECDNSAHVESRYAGIAHSIHFARHEGYELKTPMTFIQRYGEHMMRFLQNIQSLATVGGDIVPTIFKAPALTADAQRVLMMFKDSDCLPRFNFIADHIHTILKSINKDFNVQHCQYLTAPTLRSVGSFLVRRHQNHSLGNLHRTMTPKNILKWVCIEHTKENNSDSDLKALRQTIDTIGGRFDEERGLVTVRLESKHAKSFFEMIKSYILIHEIDLTLCWGIAESDMRLLRRAILASTTVSTLSVHVDIPRSKYKINQSVSGKSQLLKLLSTEKVKVPGPFRNIAINGVQDILEEYDFGYKSCLAYSIALDRVSFNWDKSKSKKRLLELIELSPYLTGLQLCCNTLASAYNQTKELIRRSKTLENITFTTDSQDKVEFIIRAGAIELVNATVQSQELVALTTWGARIERLTVKMERPTANATNDDGLWNTLETLIPKTRCIVRLDLCCPISTFCSNFQRVKAIVGPDSSLETICLRQGKNKIFVEDIRNPISTTMVDMDPEGEKGLRFWETFSTFGFFPAYDTEPYQPTDEQISTLHGYFLHANEIRLKELNLDISALTSYGLQTLSSFLRQHKNVCIRISGLWTRVIHDTIVSQLGSRLTGFNMWVRCAGFDALVVETLRYILKTVFVSNASLKFTTTLGNTIFIPNLHTPTSAEFTIKHDEPFDFAVTKYFNYLSSTLLCEVGFTDADVSVLRNLLIEQQPSRLRNLTVSIESLSKLSLHDLAKSLSSHASEVELKVCWTVPDIGVKPGVHDKLLFLSDLAPRISHLKLGNVKNLGNAIETPQWNILRSVEMNDVEVTDWFFKWIRSMISPKLRHLALTQVPMNPSQWNEIVGHLSFSVLSAIRITASQFPATLLEDLYNRIPVQDSVLRVLAIECEEKQKKNSLGMKKKLKRIPFEKMVSDKVPACNVSLEYTIVKGSRGRFSCMK